MNYRVNSPSLAVIDIPDLRPQFEAFALICASVKPSMLADVRLRQPKNAEVPMLVTLDGIVTEVRLLQPLNADSPMFFTLDGIVMEVKLLQPENAAYPILVTLLEIVTDVRPLQY